MLDRVVLNTLFPDTSYANESGGDPEVIPELTYEQFLDFHRKYYHPSNSYIYLYGDMDMEEKLDWLDKEYLSKFDFVSVDSEIKYQDPFDKIVEKEIPYSIASDESEEDNTYLSYNKVIGTSLDKNCIWHSRSWIMHYCPHRERRLRKRLQMRGSERTLWDPMTMGSTSLFFPSYLRMRIKSRKTLLSR